MAKSYFAILGIPSNASPDTIRAAYRRLAKEFHPDRFSGGSGPFLQIQEAYSILSNEAKRSRYEASLARTREEAFAQRPKPEPLIPKERPVDRSEIFPLRSFETFAPSFDEIFDWLWDNFSDLDWPKSGRIQHLTVEIVLTKEQAERGGTARVMVPARARCPLCLGRGGVGFYECSRCAGEGAITGDAPVSVSFPAGLRQDHAVVIPLERFGIRNLRLTVLFRVTDEP